MIDISTELQDAFKAHSREIHTEITLNFSDLSLDKNSTVSSAEQNEPVFNYQLINGNTVTDCKWAVMDGETTDMSGDYCMCPSDTTTNAYQIGLWSEDVTDASGVCDVTFNIARSTGDLSGLALYGDNMRQEYMIDFTIEFYDDGGLIHTDTVVNNTSIAYDLEIGSTLEDVVNIIFNITKWSEPLTPVKVLAVRTDLLKKMNASDILDFSITDESEIVGTSTIPTGNISYGYSAFSFLNRDRVFDVNNTASPLYGQIKQNTKIDVSVGARTVNGIEMVKIFSGWTDAITTDDNSLIAATQATDRLKRLSLSDMTPTAVLIDYTVGAIFDLIFADADISSEFLNIESLLYESTYQLPIYYIKGSDHLAELRRLSEAVSTSVYVVNDVITVESIVAISLKYETQETYDLSDYTNKANQPLYDAVYNSVTVPYNVYTQIDDVEVYSTSTNELERINLGTKEYVFTFSEKSCINHVLNYTPVGGVTVGTTNYYSDRAVIEFVNSNGIDTDITITIDADVYEISTRKTVSDQDNDSIESYGISNFTYGDNQIVQTQGLSNVIATNILQTYKDPFRDITLEMQYAGNPALELTDKITVEDRYLEQSYNIVNKTLSFDGGLSMQIKAKKASLKDYSLIDNLNNNFVDDLGNTIIALTSDIVETFDLVDNNANKFVTDKGFQIIIGG